MSLLYFLRYKPDLIEKSILNSHKCSIDVIYLDNTFCSPECRFPTQREARQTILDIIKQHRHYNIVLGMRKLGKEKLLAWLGLSLKEWISIPGEMYARIQTLELPNVFRISDKTSRIRVEPFHLASTKMLKRWNEARRTIVILPTAIYTGIGGIPYANQKDMFVVPYSDHSSYPELMEFVSKLRPCAVVPIVSSKTRGPFGVDISSRADMSCFDKYCRTPVDGMKSRQPLRTTAKLPGILLPVPHVDGKRKSLKRRWSVGHRKVKKGIEYLSEDEASDGRHMQGDVTVERIKAKICCTYLVANPEKNLHDSCSDERMKQKVICNDSVANTDGSNLLSCSDVRVKQKNSCNYSVVNRDGSNLLSCSDVRVKQKNSCNYSVAKTDESNFLRCSDVRVKQKNSCNYSVVNRDGSNLLSCSDVRVKQKNSCNYSVAKTDESNFLRCSDVRVKQKNSCNYSVANSVGVPLQVSCSDKKVEMKINCNYSASSSDGNNFQNCTDDRVTDKTCFNYSVTNTDVDLQVFSCDETPKQKISSKYSVSSTYGENQQDCCSDKRVKQKIIYSYSDEENHENSTCEEKVADITTCNYSVTNSNGNNIRQNCSDDGVKQKTSCDNLLINTVGENFQENCTDQRMKDNSSYMYSVANLDTQNLTASCSDENVSEMIVSNYSMTNSDGHNQDGCPDDKVKEKINCSCSVTKFHGGNSMVNCLGKRLELYCKSPTVNSSKVRKQNDCLITKLNSQAAFSNGNSKDEIGLKSDTFAKKEKKRLLSANCRCSYNQEQTSSLPLSLPDSAVTKHMTDLRRDGVFTKRTNKCHSRKNLGPLKFSNESYNVKTLKQMKRDDSTKKLVLALEKWLSDT